jgi:hypothetical protein
MRPPPRHWTLALLIALLAPASTRSQEPVANWDPPAIDVFPDHTRGALDRGAAAEMVEAGRRLFSTRFNLTDGAVRPLSTGDSKPTLRPASPRQALQRLSGPDANSCAGCHNQPKVGGSGDFAVNVFVGAHFADPVATTILETTTSERNTIGLFGSGVIESLAREMTDDLQAIKSQCLTRARTQHSTVALPLRTNGVSFGSLTCHVDGTLSTSGLEGIDSDLVIKPFGAKGVVISLREFSINALNQHHGIQAVERFGWERTGIRDFDGDGVEVEFTVGQVSALSLFQASLPPPERRTSPSSAPAQVRGGERLFAAIGCADCHRPRLALRRPEFSEPNPYNRPGNLVPNDQLGTIRIPLPVSSQVGSGLFRDEQGSYFVAAYTDLKRHVICDDRDPFFCNERLRQDFVPTDQFLTAKLWDVSTSMPYGHRGDCTTLSEVIVHHSGEAYAARQAFFALSDNDKRAVVLFLRTLGASLEDR